MVDTYMHAFKFSKNKDVGFLGRERDERGETDGKEKKNILGIGGKFSLCVKEETESFPRLSQVVVAALYIAINHGQRTMAF